MSRISIFLLIISISPLALGVELINEAFGVKLGEVVDPLKNEERLSFETEYSRIYSLEGVKNDNFSTYSIETSKKTDKVYKISGSKRITGLNNCDKRINDLKEVLTFKYGDDINSESGKYENGFYYNIFLIHSKNGNFISVGCYEVDPWGEKKFWTGKDKLQFQINIEYSVGEVLLEIKGKENLPKIDRSGL